MTYVTEATEEQEELERMLQMPESSAGVRVVDGAVHFPPDWNPIADIVAMHEHYGLNYDGPPRVLDIEEARFRGDFKLEECEEWRTHAGRALMLLGEMENGGGRDVAAITHELAEMLDALVDGMVILLGTAYRQGVIHRLPEAWRRVFVANMAKEVGKTSRGFAADLVKPPGWQAPDHSDLVEDHAHR